MKKVTNLKKMASRLEQVAPYLLKIDRTLPGGGLRHNVYINTRYSLICLAKETGSLCKRKYGSDRCEYFNVSDPLCQMLEQAGMNE